MKKTIVITVPLVTLLLMTAELASSKPVDHSKNPNFDGVTTKSVASLSDHQGDLTELSYAGFDMPDSISTDTTDNKKITEDLDSEEFSRLTTWNPGFEKLSRLPVTLKPGSWTTGSLVTPVEPVSEETSSSAISSEPSFGEADSLLTTVAPGSLSTTQLDVDSVKPGSLQITLEPGSKRRDNLATTSEPVDSHHTGNESNHLPVKTERRNGASDVRSSCVVVLLGILLISGSQVT